MPNNPTAKVRQMLSRVKLAIESIFVNKLPRSRVISQLYYGCFSMLFSREQQAVLAGKRQYNLHNGVQGETSAQLRRNIHRLEKGLIMKPRKPVFAEGYISETVATFEQCIQQTNFSQQELSWACDVLTRYFKSVEVTEVIETAKCRFQALSITASQELLATPYFFKDRNSSKVSAHELYNLFKQRRSVRWFEDKAVDLAVIKQAIEMATQAPSACNRQPFNFYTITNPEKASEIASIPMGTKGFAQNIQALIVVVGDLSYYPKERDRHVIYIDGGLVAMQLMLAFESLGLSTCPINWPDMETYEKKMERALNIKKYQRPIMLMAVGYGDPEGQIPFSQKKTADQLIKVVE